MEQIYVLKCEKKKYYIGKTSNIDQRLAQHFNGTGSEWTQKYAPRDVVKIEDAESEFDEMKKTLEYMKKFGVDHVRGAQWSNVTLTPEQRTEIKRAINTNGCFHCGKTGHYANECRNRSQSSRTVQCFRCRDYGHYANECPEIMCCERCGRDSHDTAKCYATFDIDDRVLECARCGRDTHSADECFAKAHINGRRLH